jgi:PPOX class probable F420-dependent enzyme
MKRRNQIQLTPEEQAELVREERKCSLATIGPDGFPHLVAMNYAVVDGAYCMTSYGKAQKVLNIRREPRVALMIETGKSYAELRGIMVRGRCEIVEGADAVHAAFRAMAEARGETYAPRASGSSAPKRVVLRVVAEKLVSWDHRKLGGTY